MTQGTVYGVPIDTDPTMALNSNQVVPSQAAVVTYVANNSAKTLTGNTGGALSPSAGNWNIVGTGSTTASGSGSTLTVQMTGLTNHNVLIGAGTATVTNVAPSATSGVPLISQGSSADPVFGTAVVAGGGTGVATMPAYAIVCGGTTTTGAFQSVADVATGQVLVSGGTAALPAFSATPTVTSITFGAGTALSTYAEGTFTPTMIGGSTAGSTSYSTQNGTYTRIGNLVTLFAIVAGSSATGTGSVTYAGFPFTVKNQTPNAWGTPLIVNARTWPTSRTTIVFQPNTAVSQGVIQTQGSGQAFSTLQMQNISFNDQYTCSYQI